jgi:hypothetical protein
MTDQCRNRSVGPVVLFFSSFLEARPSDPVFLTGAGGCRRVRGAVGRRPLACRYPDPGLCPGHVLGAFRDQWVMLIHIAMSH